MNSGINRLLGEAVLRNGHAERYAIESTRVADNVVWIDGYNTCNWTWKPMHSGSWVQPRHTRIMTWPTVASAEQWIALRARPQYFRVVSAAGIPAELRFDVPVDDVSEALLKNGAPMYFAWAYSGHEYASTPLETRNELVGLTDDNQSAWVNVNGPVTGDYSVLVWTDRAAAEAWMQDYGIGAYCTLVRVGASVWPKLRINPKLLDESLCKGGVAAMRVIAHYPCWSNRIRAQTLNL